jgi:hypothetical protein
MTYASELSFRRLTASMKSLHGKLRFIDYGKYPA